MSDERKIADAMLAKSRGHFMGSDTNNERAAFESHMREHGEDYLYRRDVPTSSRIGEYCRQSVQDRWETWRAARTESPAAPAQSGDAVAMTSEQREAINRAMGDAKINGRMDDLQTLSTLLAAPQPYRPAKSGEPKRWPTPISISTDKICEIAGKYNLGNPRLDALRCFANEVIIVNEAEYAKSE